MGEQEQRGKHFGPGSEPTRPDMSDGNLLTITQNALLWSRLCEDDSEAWFKARIYTEQRPHIMKSSNRRKLGVSLSAS